MVAPSSPSPARGAAFVLPDWVPPALSPGARRALRAGRRALRHGDRAGARAAFAEGMARDRRLVLHDWRLLPVLRAAGQQSLRLRLNARQARWAAAAPDSPEAELRGLVHKPVMRAWATGRGVPLPPLLAQAPTLALLDWAALPADGIVIKPAGSHSRHGVIALKDGQDILRHSPVGPDLAAYARSIWDVDGMADQAVLVEALLPNREPPAAVARDIKGFAAGGWLGALQVIDRNDAATPHRTGYFDATGGRIPTLRRKYPDYPEIGPPAGLDTAVALIERLSAMLPWFLRFDVYLTPDGPVLGEITTHPTGGLGYSPFGRRLMLQLWEIAPQREEASS